MEKELMEGELIEGELCDVKVNAKNPHGEGIGRINNIPVFIRNANIHIGKIYKVRITKIHRTFAYAEPADNSKYLIGSGSLIML
jgi:predicted RNA-binding protein with TRAM domain